MTENSMELRALVVQQPVQAAQLVLLFHGEFTTAQAMLPLATALATTFPQALIACIEAPYPNADNTRREWYVPAQDQVELTSRVQAALPAFLAIAEYWQKRCGVSALATAMVGFGQGATLALQATQSDAPPASRVVSIAGRFATLPEDDRYKGTVHFLHGKSDATVPYQHMLEAAYRLQGLGMDLTGEVIPFIGHELHQDFIDSTVEKLSTHISKHLLEERGDAAPVAPTH